MALDKVVDSAKLEADLTTVADAIRTKGGTTTPLAFPDGFKTAIDGIQAGGGGGQELADSIIDRSVTEITSNVSRVGDYALENCSKLTTASFPMATDIGWSAFSDCIALTTVNLPAVTSVRQYAFKNCSKLTTASFPGVTSLGSSAFSGCTALTTASFPVATRVGQSDFEYCTVLATVSFPVATRVDSSAFSSCKKLTTVNLPAVTSVDSSAFSNCIALTTVNLPAVTSVSSSVFYNCTALAELRLEGSEICKAYSNPSINPTCKIYVPAVLLEQYKTATNWSQYASQFVPAGTYVYPIANTAIVTDKRDAITVNSNYLGFTHGEVKVALNYDTSKLLVTPQIVPDAETPGNGTVQLTIKALTAPAEIEANTVSVTVSDEVDSFTQEFTVKVVKFAEDPVARVEPIEGAANGFALNSAGYYESQNKGKNSSYSLCKIVYNTFGLYHLYLDCINEGEGTYDYGLLSNPGVTLSSSYNADSSGVFHSFRGENSKAVKVIDYGVLPNGENFITAKFKKDSSGNSGNDSLQFKVRMEL